MLELHTAMPAVLLSEPDAHAINVAIEGEDPSEEPDAGDMGIVFACTGQRIAEDPPRVRTGKEERPRTPTIPPRGRFFRNKSSMSKDVQASSTHVSRPTRVMGKGLERENHKMDIGKDGSVLDGPVHQRLSTFRRPGRRATVQHRISPVMDEGRGMVMPDNTDSTLNKETLGSQDKNIYLEPRRRMEGFKRYIQRPQERLGHLNPTNSPSRHYNIHENNAPLLDGHHIYSAETSKSASVVILILAGIFVGLIAIVLWIGCVIHAVRYIRKQPDDSELATYHGPNCPRPRYKRYCSGAPVPRPKTGMDMRRISKVRVRRGLDVMGEWHGSDSNALSTEQKHQEQFYGPKPDYQSEKEDMYMLHTGKQIFGHDGSDTRPDRGFVRPFYNHSPHEGEDECPSSSETQAQRLLDNDDYMDKYGKPGAKVFFDGLVGSMKGGRWLRETFMSGPRGKHLADRAAVISPMSAPVFGTIRASTNLHTFHNMLPASRPPGLASDLKISSQRQSLTEGDGAGLIHCNGTTDEPQSSRQEPDSIRSVTGSDAITAYMRTDGADSTLAFRREAAMRRMTARDGAGVSQEIREHEQRAWSAETFPLPSSVIPEMLEVGKAGAV